MYIEIFNEVMLLCVIISDIITVYILPTMELHLLLTCINW